MTLKTLKQACMPRASIFDTARRDTVLDLVDLAEDRIDANEFFAENYVTEGMRLLLTEGFRRLEGRSDQGVFKLTQAMGGGKTHNLLAFGLLARHPELRESVMGGFHRPAGQGAFSGGSDAHAAPSRRITLGAAPVRARGGPKAGGGMAGTVAVRRRAPESARAA